MKYSINNQGLYNIPVAVNTQNLDNYEIAEALSDIWFWNSHDSRDTPPEEYRVKLYTDEGELIKEYAVDIEYSPTFTVHPLEG